MQAFLALVRKDLQLYLANRRALIMSLVAPILIGAFFGGIFGSGPPKISQLPVAVTDLDDSALSRALVAALAADPALKLQTLPAAQAEALVRQGKLQAALTLPAGFGAQVPLALVGGPKPTLRLLSDPSQTLAAPLVRGLLTQQVMQLAGQALVRPGGPLAAVAMAAPPAPAGSAGGTTVPAGAAPAGLQAPFTLSERQAADAGPGAGYDGYAHAFAGMGVQFILLFGVDIGIALLVLRKTGLWQRLRAAPLSRAQLLGSRMASCALIACGVFSVLMTVAVLVFGVRVRGSLAGLALLIVCFSLLTAAFGLMIAAIGRTPEAARALAILATLVLVMLGGAWVPSFIFPPWVQQIAAWTPTHWAVNGMDAMTWRGQPFSAALAPAGVMLAFAAGFAALALARFRWED